MRKTLLSTLVLTMLLVAAPWCVAQEATAGAEPMATISFSGYDALMADLDFLGKLGGNDGLAKGLEGMLKMQTQGQGLAGLDQKRPWGVAVLPNPATIADGFAFLPVTDLKQLLTVLQSLGMPSKDAGDGVTEISTPAGPSLFVKQKGDWAILSNNPAALDTAPADPTSLLAGTEKKYDLAVRLLLKNIPPALKQMAVGKLMLGVEQGLERRPEESDEEYALRTKVAKQVVEQTKAMVEDVDAVLIGLSIDSKTQTSYLDFEVTAKPGTKTAQDFAQVKMGKSNFAGFATPEATLTANWVGKLSQTDIAQSKLSIENFRAKIGKELENQELSEEEVAKAKQLIGDLTNVVLETIEAGETDGGLAVMLDATTATLLAGAHVADGAKLDKVLRDLAETAAGESPDLAAAIKLDAETYQGVKFHALSIPIPPVDHREQLVQMVGDPVAIIVGTGPKSIYLAAGREAATKLKAAIDRSKAEAGKEVPPMRASLAVTPLVQFVAAVAEEEKVRQQAGMIAMILQQAGTDNHITVTTKPIPNGVSQRLEVEAGLLKVLGAMSQMATMMAPGM